VALVLGLLIVGSRFLRRQDRRHPIAHGQTSSSPSPRRFWLWRARPRFPIPRPCAGCVGCPSRAGHGASWYSLIGWAGIARLVRAQVRAERDGLTPRPREPWGERMAPAAEARPSQCPRADRGHGNARVAATSCRKHGSPFSAWGRTSAAIVGNHDHGRQNYLTTHLGSASTRGSPCSSPYGTQFVRRRAARRAGSAPDRGEDAEALFILFSR
jgi:hypothetical protein